MRLLWIIPVFLILVAARCSTDSDSSPTIVEPPIPPVTQSLFPLPYGGSWTYQKYVYNNTPPARWALDGTYSKTASVASPGTEDYFFLIYAHEEGGVHIETSAIVYPYLCPIDDVVKHYGIESTGIYEYADESMGIWYSKRKFIAFPYAQGTTWIYEGATSVTFTWGARVVIQTLDNVNPYNCYSFTRSDFANTIFLLAEGVGLVGMIDLATDGTGEPLTGYKTKILLREHSFPTSR